MVGERCRRGGVVLNGLLSKRSVIGSEETVDDLLGRRGKRLRSIDGVRPCRRERFGHSRGCHLVRELLRPIADVFESGLCLVEGRACVGSVLPVIVHLVQVGLEADSDLFEPVEFLEEREDVVRQCR